MAIPFVSKENRKVLDPGAFRFQVLLRESVPRAVWPQSHTSDSGPLLRALDHLADAVGSQRVMTTDTVGAARVSARSKLTH